MVKELSDYKVVTEQNAPDLNKACQALIQDGWQPFGGVSCSRAIASNPKRGDGINDKITLAQAMVR